MKSQSTFKTTEIKFKLNEPFDETTADDRKTTVGVVRAARNRITAWVFCSPELMGSLCSVPADRDDPGKRQTRAETELGWQRN